VRAFVLDASVALAWFVDDPVPSYAVRIRDLVAGGSKALVPSLWSLEMTNGLLMAERRGTLTAAEVDQGLRQLEAVVTAAIEIDSVAGPTIREAFLPAHAHQLTAYDAVYLELARREGLPLATLDKGLRTAAAKAGIRSAS
jgi:predicted nucleic acid-binding protein